MAKQSVATPISSTPESRGSEHHFTIGPDDVLSVTLNKESKAFPPTAKHQDQLAHMIHGLARAGRAVIFQAENDDRQDVEYLIQPIEDLLDAIVLLSHLSQGILNELAGSKGNPA